jgi:hypothetical protein
MGQEDCFGCPNFSGCWEEGEAEAKESYDETLAELLSVLMPSDRTINKLFT